MRQCFPSIRWWVLVPLAIVLLQGMAEWLSRVSFAVGIPILGAVFSYVALITFFGTLPALLLGLGYFGKSTLAMTHLWFWLGFLPSVLLSVLLYVISGALHAARKLHHPDDHI